MIGKTIHHYRIIEILGHGGMGVVYRAEDTNLRRPVALKFLADYIARDTASLTRFRREARMASALNHPHICTIYGFEEYEGQPFIVMEFLQGAPLGEIISKEQMSIDQVLPLAIQIADALDTAHTNGIIHRDIKPTNIVISPKNHVKILDFGLSKLVSERSADNRIVGPCTVIEDTMPGKVLGTIAYMSPEQARGEHLDHRTDLFSLGAVLYEMVTRRQAFEGATSALVYDAILHRDPVPPTRINPAVPAELERIIFQLVEKDRTRRYQSANDLWQDLSQLSRQLGSADITAAAPPASRRSGRLIVSLGTLLVVSILAYTASRILKTSKQPDAGIVTFTQITTQDGPELFPSLSPDGRSVVYASPASGNWDIYFQRVGGQNAINLTKESTADDTQPALSPSGELIAFRSERDRGGIFIMGATGESVRRVTDAGFNPSWSPDEKSLVFADEGITDTPQNRVGYSGLCIVDLRTGEKRRIFRGDAVQPHWSPDGQRIAYWMRNGKFRDIWTIRPDGSDARPVTNDEPRDWSPTWSADGRYLYFTSERGGNDNLWRVRIDEATGKTLQPFEAVTTGGGSAQRMHANLSRTGNRIAYVEQMVTENLYKVSFDPLAGVTLGEATSLTKGLRLVTEPDVSPDGQWLAYSLGGTQQDIIVSKTDGTAEVHLTNDVSKDRVPRWSPDGQNIAFYSDRSGSWQLWVIRRDGSALRQITNASNNVVRAVWSPNGKQMAGTYLSGDTFILDFTDASDQRSIQALPPLENADQWFDVWSWSSDGNWLGGRRVIRSSGENLGLLLFSLQSRIYKPLLNYGESARWLKDGRRLLFLDKNKLSLIDRVSSKVTGVLSLPIPINSFALSPDNRAIYFTAIALQADLWMISQDSKN
jgi:eukaryotic-like serine/threonine-protein kinase